MGSAIISCNQDHNATIPQISKTVVLQHTAGEYNLAACKNSTVALVSITAF